MFNLIGAYRLGLIRFFLRSYVAVSIIIHFIHARTIGTEEQGKSINIYNEENQYFCPISFCYKMAP